VGEACYHLSSSLKDLHPEVEWKKIEGMRHVLVHEYFGIDIQMVWKVVKNYISTLKTDVEQILKEFE
jgi:uncharacterized protein with HEPN domain